MNENVKRAKNAPKLLGVEKAHELLPVVVVSMQFLSVVLDAFSSLLILSFLL